MIIFRWTGRARIARIYCGKITATPWRRWFAWYPATDLDCTYWLGWVEWRKVTDERSATYYEYRRLGSTFERRLNF